MPSPGELLVAAKEQVAGLNRERSEIKRLMAATVVHEPETILEVESIVRETVDGSRVMSERTRNSLDAFRREAGMLSDNAPRRSIEIEKAEANAKLEEWRANPPVLPKLSGNRSSA